MVLFAQSASSEWETELLNTIQNVDSSEGNSLHPPTVSETLRNGLVSLRSEGMLDDIDQELSLGK